MTEKIENKFLKVKGYFKRPGQPQAIGDGEPAINQPSWHNVNASPSLPIQNFEDNRPPPESLFSASTNIPPLHYDNIVTPRPFNPENNSTGNEHRSWNENLRPHGSGVDSGVSDRAGDARGRAENNGTLVVDGLHISEKERQLLVHTLSTHAQQFGPQAIDQLKEIDKSNIVEQVSFILHYFQEELQENMKELSQQKQHYERLKDDYQRKSNESIHWKAESDRLSGELSQSLKDVNQWKRGYDRKEDDLQRSILKERSLEKDKEKFKSDLNAEILSNKEIERDYEEEIKSINSKHLRILEDLKSQRQQSRSKRENAWNAERSELKRSYKEAESGYIEKIRQLGLRHEDERRTLNAQHAKFEKEKKGEIISMKTKYEADMRYIQSQSAERERQREDAHRENLRELMEENEEMKALLMKRDMFRGMTDREVTGTFQKLCIELDRLSRITWDENKEKTWPYPESDLAADGSSRKPKQHIILNSIWVILVDNIFCSPFQIFGDEGDILHGDWTKQFGEGKIF
jgi:hypothetical protein